MRCIYLIFFTLFSFFLFCQEKESRYVDTLFLKNGNKVLGKYIDNRKNPVKFCNKFNSCKKYNLTDIDFIKKVEPFKFKISEKNKIKIAKRYKKAGLDIPEEYPEILVTFYKPILKGKEYKLLMLLYQGDKYDFYSYGSNYIGLSSKLKTIHYTLLTKRGSDQVIFEYQTFLPKKQLANQVNNSFKCDLDFHKELKKLVMLTKINGVHKLLDSCDYLVKNNDSN